MIENSKENTIDGKSTSKASSSSSSSWLRLKDPRIVRVSRAFGGKDRHSKVCTVRGLRDRRVRLSVSTAIQLYDLQDRLGLNQPSKVVDWLLNAAKDEIDELPPLPIPSGNIGLSYQSMLTNNSHESGCVSQTNEFKINSHGVDWDASSHESSRSKPKPNWGGRINEDEEEKQGKSIDVDHQRQNSRANSQASSFSALLNNVSPFGYHWEQPLNQMGSHGFITTQAEDVHNFNVMSLPMAMPSPLSLSTGSSQIFLCPPGLTQSMEIDPREVNRLQMLSSSTSQHLFLNNSLTHPINAITQSLRPFQFSMAPKFVSPDKNNGDQPNKNSQFSCG